MSNAKFTGYAWHIEKVKGYNPKRKTCFNCIHFVKMTILAVKIIYM